MVTLAPWICCRCWADHGCLRTGVSLSVIWYCAGGAVDGSVVPPGSPRPGHLQAVDQAYHSDGEHGADGYQHDAKRGHTRTLRLSTDRRGETFRGISLPSNRYSSRGLVTYGDFDDKRGVYR